jgi:hypothetical protein
MRDLDRLKTNLCTGILVAPRGIRRLRLSDSLSSAKSMVPDSKSGFLMMNSLASVRILAPGNEAANSSWISSSIAWGLISGWKSDGLFRRSCLRIGRFDQKFSVLYQIWGRGVNFYFIFFLYLVPEENFW